MHRFGPPVLKVCPICTKTFQPTDRSRKYCSMECRRKDTKTYQRGPRNRRQENCRWCGKSFDRANSNFHSKHVFCGRICMAEWQSDTNRGHHHPRYRGGKPEGRGVGWKAARKEAIETSNGLCAVCKREARHVHHKLPFRFFSHSKEANHQTNLIVVCRRCHPKLEKEIRDAMPLFDRFSRIEARAHDQSERERSPCIQIRVLSR